MSDDEADPELLELLRQRLGISTQTHDGVPSETGVLKDAEFIYNNAIDVSVDMFGTKAAAFEIYRAMQQKNYSREAWSQHDLHPTLGEGFTEVDILNFVFTMDLLNFSFWSELSEVERFQVEYRGKRWTGYNSLVACLRRALDEGVAITTPSFWRRQDCSDHLLAQIFRSATNEQMPLLDERIAILREASDVLYENFRDAEEDGPDELSLDEAAIQEAVRSGDANMAKRNLDQPSIELKEESVYIEGLSTDIDGVVENTQSDAAVIIKTMDDAASGPTISEPILGSRIPEIPIEQLAIDSANDTGTISGSEGFISHDRPEIEPIPNSASETTVDISTNGTTTESETAGNPASVPSDVQESVVSLVQAADLTSNDNTRSVVASGMPAPKPDHTVVRLVKQADQSAGKLVNLLAKHFPAFRDESRFEGKRIRILKRAQIFVADLWAALNDTGLGKFHDIDRLTMFADYRVPQCLHSLGVLTYSPPLDYHIRGQRQIASGHSWEVQLRGCSIWAVELIRREIVKSYPEADGVLNAVLIDFFLYDLAKEKEAEAILTIPTHRTRSVWY